MPWAELSIGVASLYVLYRLLSPVMKAHIRTLDRVGETMVSATQALNSIQSTQGDVVQVLHVIQKDIQRRNDEAALRHQEVLAKLDCERR